MIKIYDVIPLLGAVETTARLIRKFNSAKDSLEDFVEEDYEVMLEAVEGMEQILRCLTHALEEEISGFTQNEPDS